VQTKLGIREKGDFDGILSKFQDYEASYGDQPQIALLNDDAKPPPTFAIATSSRLTGIIEKYEASQSSSRAFYDKLKREQRLLIWDGDDLLRDARQVLSRRYEVPPTVELDSVSGWNSSGPVRLGIVRAGDLAALEDAHGPGLFFENVRGWKGLDPTKNDETVNESIRRTVLEEPAEMLARNNGIVFRASSVDQDEGHLVLHDASIVNGRQTTGVLAEVRRQLGDDCEVAVKVVEAEGDAWPIAAAANNQNTVARIDLRLARYFREQLVQRELSSAAGGDEWLTEVMEPLNAREETFDHLRYLFIGLFCNRPNQLAEDNYSQLRWDVLSAYFEDGEPPAALYPTLHRITRATDEALEMAAGLGENDPFARMHDDHRPKYRAYFGLLTLCGTHDIDLSEQLPSLDAEVERVSEFIEKTAALLDGIGQKKYAENFLYAYEVAGVHAIHANREGDESRVSQRLATSLFSTPFGTLYRQLLLKIQMAGRMQAARGS
jgi:regulator of RNase E activity RraB